MPKKLTFVVTNHEVCIWPLHVLGEMLAYHLHKVYGQNYQGEMIGEWQNRTNRWALAQESHHKLTKSALNRAVKDQAWTKQIMAEIPEACSRLLEFTDSIYWADFSQKTNKDIWEMHEQFQQEFIKMYLYAWFPNALEGLDSLFTRTLQQYLVQKLGSDENAGKYLSILTTPAKDSARRKEEKEFLHLLDKVKKNEPASKLFTKKLSTIESKLVQVAPTINELITAHWHKYRWIPFDYDGPAWDMSDIHIRIKKAINNKINPLAQIKTWEQEQKEIKQQQKQIIREIKLGRDKKYSYLFELARELMYLKNYRKDVLYLSYYRLDKLIQEISRRLSLSPTQVKHILPDEMEKALIENKFSVSELDKRIRYSVIAYNKSGSKLYTGAEAKKIIAQRVKIEKKIARANKIEGETACPGQARGAAKLICTVDDLSKMESGDILVSPATNPNLLPAMKKAGAIITDKGGITSHAAIISRELKIPCITGTKIATKALKDGDKIKVNADQGMITRIMLKPKKIKVSSG